MSLFVVLLVYLSGTERVTKRELSAARKAEEKIKEASFAINLSTFVYICNLLFCRLKKSIS